MKKKLQSVPMRTKLILSFSVTVLGALCLLAGLLYRIISNDMNRRLLGSASQSVEQAASSIELYYFGMEAATNLISYNAEVLEVLSSKEFLLEEDGAKRYREFLTLNNALSMAEIGSNISHARLFVPDDIIYSHNQVHIAPYSELEDSAYYSEYLKDINNKDVFVSPPHDIRFTDHNTDYNQLSLYKNITYDGENIGLCEVSIAASSLQSILDNMESTEGSFATITGPEGQSILGKSELFTSLELTREWTLCRAGEIDYYTMAVPVFNSNWNLTMFIPSSEMLAPIYRMGKMLALVTFLIGGLIVIVSMLIGDSFTSRITLLEANMQLVQEGNYRLRYQNLGSDEIGKLNDHFHYLTEELKKQLEMQYQIGRQAEMAELKALQAQINPHFLYNTLDLLTWEAREHNAPEMAELVQNLAKFYRLSLNQGKDFSTIGSEIEHITTYVAIENCHYDYGINLQVECPEEYNQYECIHILLQPFIENAIRHGIGVDLIGNSLEIKVSIECEGQDLLITITDDGAGMTEEAIRELHDTLNQIHPTKGYGIRNVQQRIRILYGEEYGIHINSKIDEGTTVVIRLPKKTKSK